MTLTLPISAEAEASLRKRAAAAGQDMAAFATHLLERAAAKPSVDELLAPFRRQVADSGMNDDQLDEFFESVREDVWQERNPGAGKVS